MYSLIRKCLFLMDAETAHNFSIQALKLAGKLPINVLPMPLNPVEVMGLQFKNPIGLAAGADKNGEAIDGFGKLGFGFIEVGTVTPVVQDGNPKPRQFRILEAEGIINRNGFNNLGVDVLVENVKKAKYDGIIGINIGKNAVTPIERALDDYQICLRKVYEHADYITVNISSPNTKNLRTLQYGEALDDLLRSLKSEQESLSQKFNRYKPLVLKIAPDLTDEEIASVADGLVRHKIDGVIAGNTTLSRDPVVGLKNAEQQGGLSGKPLNTLSTRLISTLAKELNGALPIIGSGGIHSVASGQEKIDAGASLLQVYSAMIYQGPALIQNLAKHIQVR
ncbi:quinone-dependent dihydroorotate dehydrogenase [Actinobacillus pleuropneumoniae]|uniref:Dihydroorotate dehydrogenase (quinone) n=1 Tax=Actinobacillus pleuropneumoniae TaxID=715 RepID=A0A9Q4H5A6_ACTPL|nr:quinone-dependent dihydroorotate dehydrogenase [Actinobacillus pleuropneumoniae]MBT9318218.1 quinone-dependent dihydroorotate dehydrogenase [Actinobacillus pleuropneumoniae]MBT9343070.1 quinone-dependent dihydroorotate dehydrogenase [Actinobacillus pleuropneumoniae]MCL7720524.1 quinone-dependent dihydroorotate dehydrogenase [Actinobacillus pleuropneumoniae]MCL7724443.1 quinone-dependent dihydroorotate dehydrogenase [Actinobacillus pleuropneumoniae]MCL7727929.1 quinone-dependent dihydroorota